MSLAKPTCVITGAGGYLGGRLKLALPERGWRVREATRDPRPGSSAVRFHLGQSVAPADLAGAKALVHCAYDFKALKWEHIRAINVSGSEKLFQAAREAQVRHLIYISSISAYEGCRSLYGKAKLETEAIAARAGAVLLRPGLIWGDPPGAMFGRLVQQVTRARLLPLVGGGAQVQYLVHELDLATCISRCAGGESVSAGAPITVAHEKPWTFRQILEEIARAQGKHPRFLPVPWRLLWAVIKAAEVCGVPVSFRSDSLVSLMYQNPDPSFAEQRQQGWECRPFRY